MPTPSRAPRPAARPARPRLQSMVEAPRSRAAVLKHEAMLRSSARITRLVLLVLSLVAGAVVAACNGCRRDGKGNGTNASSDAGPPSVRVYVLSDVAGALEPCGCQKDMLGGVDHFAALVTKEHEKAPNALVVTAGPLFFMDVVPKVDHVDQDGWKAEALAAGLKSVGLAGFAPGKNDWAEGGAFLAKVKDASGGAMCAANLKGEGAGSPVGHVVRDVGGVKVAIVGVSSPKDASGAPTGVDVDDAAKALTLEAQKARAEGARIVIGVVAIDRGEAVRAAEQTPDLDVLAVGSPSLEGDANDDPKPPRFVGNVLVVEPSNHLTRASIVDFYLRSDGKFADGSGLQHAAEVTDLGKQIDDLQKRIANWEKDPSVVASDLAAQKKRLDELRDKLQKAQAPPPTPTGNFLRYSIVDVREGLGVDPKAKEAMKSYYVRVNEFNQKKFAGKKAPSPSKDEPQYVGVEVCKTCHAAPFDVWSKTPHAKAYKTLADDSKEFNLDCVGCHVTGYEKPGGSTVTDVAQLKDVQCEQCHGAGSKHISDPYANALAEKPDETTCTGPCHHAPHTDIFEFKSRVEKVKGPGHGMPGAPSMNDPPKGWKPPSPRFL